jgi:hypothetical protein
VTRTAQPHAKSPANSLSDNSFLSLLTLKCERQLPIKQQKHYTQWCRPVNARVIPPCPQKDFTAKFQDKKAVREAKIKICNDIVRVVGFFKKKCCIPS